MRVHVYLYSLGRFSWRSGRNKYGGSAVPEDRVRRKAIANNRNPSSGASLDPVNGIILTSSIGPWEKITWVSTSCLRYRFNDSIEFQAQCLLSAQSCLVITVVVAVFLWRIPAALAFCSRDRKTYDQGIKDEIFFDARCKFVENFRDDGRIWSEQSISFAGNPALIQRQSVRVIRNAMRSWYLHMHIVYRIAREKATRRWYPTGLSHISKSH